MSAIPSYSDQHMHSPFRPNFANQTYSVNVALEELFYGQNPRNNGRETGKQRSAQNFRCTPVQRILTNSKTGPNQRFSITSSQTPRGIGSSGQKMFRASQRTNTGKPSTLTGPKIWNSKGENQVNQSPIFTPIRVASTSPDVFLRKPSESPHRTPSRTPITVKDRHSSPVMRLSSKTLSKFLHIRLSS